MVEKRGVDIYKGTGNGGGSIGSNPIDAKNHEQGPDNSIRANRGASNREESISLGGYNSSQDTTPNLVVKVVPGSRSRLKGLGDTTNLPSKQPHGANPYLGAQSTQLPFRQGGPYRKGTGMDSGAGATQNPRGRGCIRRYTVPRPPSPDRCNHLEPGRGAPWNAARRSTKAQSDPLQGHQRHLVATPPPGSLPTVTGIRFNPMDTSPRRGQGHSIIHPRKPPGAPLKSQRRKGTTSQITPS